MLSWASSLVYGRFADIAKLGDQTIEGVRVLHEQHVDAVLDQPAPAIEAGDCRPDPSRNSGLVFKRDPNVEDILAHACPRSMMLRSASATPA
jgi:hypothetical protein